MRFTAAFSELGYAVAQPRQDWSSASPTGICLSLWQKEVKPDGRGACWIDTRLHAKDNGLWRTLPGNKKRIVHLQQALRDHDGYIDVVIVQGEPGEGVKDASPWFSAKRQGRWRVVDLDEATGHFRAVVEAFEPAP